MITICIATNNQHKIEEIRALLGPFFQLKSLQEIGCFEDLAETQSTIEGNSLQKAQYVFDTYGVPCFADDTGLEVDILNGAPGVHSARYAGVHKNSEDNIDLLLKNLANSSNRNARFKTIITLVEPEQTTTFEGIVEGTIQTERRGNKGFGYDSVFKPTGFTKTFAELSLEEKNLISHRAIAVKKLINFLLEKYK
jgi:XTP/dITP diphosphohydrolase